MKNRENEILKKIEQFGNGEYFHGEELEEIRGLIQAVVTSTFDEDHANYSNLNLYDVYKHMEQMNNDCGNIADAELRSFERMNKDLHNYEKGLISGEEGEKKAEKYIKYVKSEKRVLKNVELNENGVRNELDFVVITPKCVTIVEVKNTRRDVFISEDGKQYRTGEFTEYDCEIGEKLIIKENLLKHALGIEKDDEITVRKILLFTNHKIKVQNKCENIKVCFPTQLPYLIDEFEDESKTTIDMDMVEEAIMSANLKQKYPIRFDLETYKNTFTALMAKLEKASSNDKTEEATSENLDTLIQNNCERLERIKELCDMKINLERAQEEYEKSSRSKKIKYSIWGYVMAALSGVSTITALVLVGIMLKNR